MKKMIGGLLLVVVILVGSSQAIGQPGNPGPPCGAPPCGPGPPVPIDGGLIILAAAGAALGIKKLL